MDDLVRGALTRRTFLKSTTALATLAGLGLTLPALAQGTPTSGGVLALSITSDPPNYDPLSGTGSFVINVIAPCYNSIVRFNPENSEEVIGDLAESWTVSESGTEIVFALKRDVRWHDGKPFTAEDVKFTFDVMRDPPADKLSVRKDLLSNLTEIIVNDPQTVTFRLAQPQESFVKVLAIGWMLVLPKHILETPDGMTLQVVGTGPFRFKGHQQGVSIELERNPDYHVEGLPYLDGMTFYVLPDRTTSFAYLRTGQLHMVDGMDGQDAERVTAEFGDLVDVQRIPSYSYSNVLINADRAPFNDIRVRKAISLALDREDALKVLREGYGVVGSLMPPGPWALTPEELATVPGYGGTREERLAEARQLLADAGHPDGFAVQMTARRQAVLEAQSIWVQSQLEPLGITMELDLQESATYFDNLNNRNFAITAYARTIDVDDPAAIFGGIHACESALNYPNVCAEDLESLLRADLDFSSPEQRRANAAKMNLAVMNQFGDLPLYWRDRFLPVARKVHGVFLHPSPDNNRRFDTVWMDA